jgi:cell filamentation protein
VPNLKPVDPYLYPDTLTLINKFNVKDPAKLQQLEATFFLSKKSEPLPAGQFDFNHLKSIHYHFFHDLYEWAGQERTIDIVRGDDYFAHKEFIASSLNKLLSKLQKDNLLQNLPLTEFCEKLSFYFNEINAVHAFREGNGRTQRAFCDALAEQAGYLLDWTQVNPYEYTRASILGFQNGDYDSMRLIFEGITRKNISFKFDHSFKSETKEFIKEYIDKQIQITTNIHQRNIPKNTETIQKSILALNKEAIKIAKELLTTDEVKILLNEKNQFKVQQQSSFLAIQERLQKNEMTLQDTLSVFRHAKENLSTASQLLNKNIERGRGRSQ